MNEIAEIKEGAWVRTKDGRRVQIWRITAEDGCYCSDLQHHCSSELQSTTEPPPRAMTKPLSERLNDARFADAEISPRIFSLLEEAEALARRVEVACTAFIFSKAAPEPHQVSGLTAEDDAVIDSLDCKRVALVPVEGGP